jgi:hypothetical protein
MSPLEFNVLWRILGALRGLWWPVPGWRRWPGGYRGSNLYGGARNIGRSMRRVCLSFLQ